MVALVLVSVFGFKFQLRRKLDLGAYASTLFPPPTVGYNRYEQTPYGIR